MSEKGRENVLTLASAVDIPYLFPHIRARLRHRRGSYVLAHVHRGEGYRWSWSLRHRNRRLDHYLMCLARQEAGQGSGNQHGHRPAQSPLGAHPWRHIHPICLVALV